MNCVELRDAVSEFDRRLASLDEAQSAVEGELGIENLERDIDEAAEFRDNARVPRVTAEKILASRINSEVGHVTSDAASVTGASAMGMAIEAKLPKLELPIFTGDVTTWVSFWEQFHAVVHTSELPDITKFAYRLSLLKGEAKVAVQGLSMTSVNYKSACEILEKRFGRPERIIFSLIQDLLSINVPRQPKVAVLWKMYDNLQAHVRSLEALQISGKQYGVMLTPLILSRLPPDLRLEWAREGEHHEGDLSFLLDFLQREIERRERSLTFSTGLMLHMEADDHVENLLPSTVAALHTSTNQEMQACGLCGRGGHPIERCYSITRIPVQERKMALSKVQACFRCLSTVKSHSFRKCQAKCSKCRGKHHSLLCENEQRTVVQPASSALQQTPTPVTHTSRNSSVIVSNAGVVSSVNSVADLSSHVLLQTARVSVQGKCGVADAIILFDMGLDKTYISETLVGKIGTEWVGSQSLAYASFGSSNVSSTEQRNLYSVVPQGPGGNATNVVATEIPVICTPIYRPPVPESVLKSVGKDI